MIIPKELIIHHESASNGFLAVNEWHRTAKDKWGDFMYHYGNPSELGFWIGYHYYIDKTGKTWQGRNDTEQGAHTKGRNIGSIGICLEGNLDAEEPTIEQTIALKNLITKKMFEWDILPNAVVGHRFYANKSCPGKNLTEAEIKELFNPDLGYIEKMIIKLQQMITALKSRMRVGESSKVEEDNFI